MSNRNELTLIVKRISAGLSCQELIESLKAVTDADYNGENGEDYFTHSKTCCDLEYLVEKLYSEGNCIQNIIEAVIEDNYSNSYYTSYKYHIEDMIDDDYLVVIAYS